MIAKNTVEALQSGMVFGVASQVEGIVGRMIAELGADAAEVRVIATGYLARSGGRRVLVLHRPRAVADAAGPRARIHSELLPEIGD